MFAFPLKLQVEALKGRGPGRNKEDRGVFIPKCLKVSHRLFRTRQCLIRNRLSDLRFSTKLQFASRVYSFMHTSWSVKFFFGICVYGRGG